MKKHTLTGAALLLLAAAAHAQTPANVMRISQQGNQNDYQFTQEGRYQEADLKQTGDGNQALTTQTGFELQEIKITQHGNDNEANVLQTTNNNVIAEVNQSGEGNQVTIEQFDLTGSVFKAGAVVRQEGSDHEAFIRQVSNDNSSVNIIQKGSGNQLSLVQDNPTGLPEEGQNNYLFVAQVGYQNVATATQTGSFNGIYFIQGDKNPNSQGNTAEFHQEGDGHRIHGLDSSYFSLQDGISNHILLTQTGEGGLIGFQQNGNGNTVTGMQINVP